MRKVEDLIEEWLERKEPNESSNLLSVERPTPNLPQEVYILLKNSTGRGYELRMFVSQFHSQSAASQSWKLNNYYLLRFELPAGSSSYEFRLSALTKSQQFTNFGKESYFAMESLFENANASKLETMTLSEELCVIGLMLGDGDKLVRFINFLASEGEVNRRNKAYSQLKLLK